MTYSITYQLPQTTSAAIIINSLNIQKLAMSSKFTSSSTTLAPSTIFRQEQLIREIVQHEVLLIFDDIKLQIQTKIKSIDKNILELRNQIRRINQHSTTHNKTQHDLAEVIAKIEKIEAQMQIVRYQHQAELRTSRAKSFQKERKPIFRKSGSEHSDFSSVLLSLQSQPKLNIESKLKEKHQIMMKPPLPRQGSRPKSQLTNPSKQPLSQSKTQKRKLMMQDSGTIHRWLHQNNNRQSSCMSSIIRQQDIEQSVYY